MHKPRLNLEFKRKKGKGKKRERERKEKTKKNKKEKGTEDNWRTDYSSVFQFCRRMPLFLADAC